MYHKTKQQKPRQQIQNMNKYIITTFILMSLSVVFGPTVNAQTNSVVSKSNDNNTTNNSTSTQAAIETNAPAKDYDKFDLTISSAGTSYGGKNEVGVDVSASIDPLFKTIPSLWVGVSQSLYWQPTFAGSTDIDIDWSINIYKQLLYLNPGWSVGKVYGANTSIDLWRTGPEVTLQYYVCDNAYIYVGVNYDLITKELGDGWQTSGNNDGWRWGIGIGLEF